MSALVSQTQKIMDVLSDYSWHCTSEFYAMYMADPRRRLCDLRDKGIVLESRRCEIHDFHRGGSKMWRLVVVPSLMSKAVLTEIKPRQERLFVLLGQYHN